MTALVALLREDAEFSMPPFPLWVKGTDEIVAFMTGTGRQVRGLAGAGDLGQRRPGDRDLQPDGDGDSRRGRSWCVETSDGRISGLHHFIYPELFAEFGLPARLEREHAG